jgi:hypothetical protein
MTDWTDGERLAWLRNNAASLRQRTAAVAASIADTEEGLADTLDRIARIRPKDAERLHAKADQARKFAAHERTQAAIYGLCADIPVADLASDVPADDPAADIQVDGLIDRVPTGGPTEG